ncbi:MAG TPA: acyclic terpene utilization AtuA family protein [Gemmatimonadaceae bacterium]|nr:acyclic terpene utilization AtuA family protein [Gemmatimonadaceae bacterium]
MSRATSLQPPATSLRIASGQGFWGDLLSAPVEQVRRGRIDYLMLDYLAEVTMSILQKQKARNPAEGYARDFVPLMGEILPDCVAKGIRVVANAGGVNVPACRDGILEQARTAGLEGRMSVGAITGDDILGRLGALVEAGHSLRNMDDGRPLSDVIDRVQSANAYIGAAPIVAALARGATVVVTGRSTDTALTYAPMMHAFGWAPDDWDRLAAGVVAGHINECGAQCTGGNCLLDWETIPDLAGIGFPIIEASPDGSFVVTKHEGTGGRVTTGVVTEQLLYELGDPAHYITPDVIADFTTIRLTADGPDRVRVSGVRGRPRTDMLKVSISYSAGFKAVGTLVYGWPDPVAKAQAADRVLRARLDRLGLRFDEIRTELVGWNATHGALAGPPPEGLPEVELRVAVRADERAPVERFTREIAPLVLTGPPTVTGFAGGRPRVQEIVAFWPALIDRDQIEPHLNVEVTVA